MIGATGLLAVLPAGLSGPPDQPPATSGMASPGRASPPAIQTMLLHRDDPSPPGFPSAFPGLGGVRVLADDPRVIPDLGPLAIPTMDEAFPDPLVGRAANLPLVDAPVLPNDPLTPVPADEPASGVILLTAAACLVLMRLVAQRIGWRERGVCHC